MFLSSRTKKQIVEVFRYCCSQGLIARREGLIALEHKREYPLLGENGKPLFNRKINQFLQEAQLFIVLGTAKNLPEVNKNLIRNLHPSRSSKIIMTVAGIMLEELWEGESDWQCDALNRIAVYLNMYKGDTLSKRLGDIAKEYQKESLIAREEKHLTPEVKARIIEMDKFLRQKEEYCRTILKEAEEKIPLLKAPFSENTKVYAFVKYARRKNADERWHDTALSVRSESYTYEAPIFNDILSSSHAVGNIPVCAATESFCISKLRYTSYDVEQFMRESEIFLHDFERNYEIKISYEVRV